MEVSIVSSNPLTLDGLQAYLRNAGVAARVVEDIDRLVDTLARPAAAYVIFPDDFRWESVVAALADLAERCRNPLLVFVTAHPQRVADLTHGARALIVPRPVWGWTLLEVIRAHGGAPEEEPGGS